MTSSPAPQHDSSGYGFWHYLGWTIALGLVFGIGLIVGQRWTADDDSPFVHVDASRVPAAPDATSASAGSTSPSSSPDVGVPSVDFSFYDRLAEGVSPPPDRRPGPPSAERAAANAGGRPDPDASSSSAGRDAGIASARYTLQISAHRELSNAKTRLKQLRKKGLDPYLVTANLDDKGTYYRVRLGKFESMEEARSFQQALERKRGVDASIMPF